MSTIKTNRRSLNNFDDKRFHLNHIKSFPHDENLYLFKNDLVNNIWRTSLDLNKDQLLIIF